MRVFKVWVEDWNLDEFDCFVVVSDSRDAILKNFIFNKDYCEYKYNQRDQNGLMPLFKGDQIKTLDDVHIDEIDLEKECVICSSYNAG